MNATTLLYVKVFFVLWLYVVFAVLGNIYVQSTVIINQKQVIK